MLYADTSPTEGGSPQHGRTRLELAARPGERKGLAAAAPRDGQVQPERFTGCREHGRLDSQRGLRCLHELWEQWIARDHLQREMERLLSMGSAAAHQPLHKKLHHGLERRS